jgi:hypothetical protein
VPSRFGQRVEVVGDSELGDRACLRLLSFDVRGLDATAVAEYRARQVEFHFTLKRSTAGWWRVVGASSRVAARWTPSTALLADEGDPLDAASPRPGYFGCGTILRYGRGAFHPDGYFCFASESETAFERITSSPGFQFTGVDTLCLAVS